SFHDIIKRGGASRARKVKRLIHAGGDLDEIRRGVTPAMLAVRWAGQYDIACMLVDAGADIDILQAGSAQRLAHHVESDRRIRAPAWTPKQRAAYLRLVRRLEQRGESFEEIRRDLDRWSHLYKGS